METDAAIVRRAIDGDERAMRMLWNYMYRHVDAIALGDWRDPVFQDIAQEVWIQIPSAGSGWARSSASDNEWRSICSPKAMAAIAGCADRLDREIGQRSTTRGTPAGGVHRPVRTPTGHAHEVHPAHDGRLHARRSPGTRHHGRWIQVPVVQGARQAPTLAGAADRCHRCKCGTQLCDTLTRSASRRSTMNSDVRRSRPPGGPSVPRSMGRRRWPARPCGPPRATCTTRPRRRSPAGRPCRRSCAPPAS